MTYDGIQTIIRNNSHIKQAIAYEQTKGTPEEDIVAKLNQVFGKSKKQAVQIAQNLDFDSNNQEWAAGYFAGMLNELKKDNWISGGDLSPATDELWVGYISAELGNLDFYSSLPAVWLEHHDSASFIATSINAIAKANQAFNQFNFFDAMSQEAFSQKAIKSLSSTAQAAIALFGQEYQHRIGSPPEESICAPITQSILKTMGNLLHASLAGVKIKFLADVKAIQGRQERAKYVVREKQNYLDDAFSVAERNCLATIRDSVELYAAFASTHSDDTYPSEGMAP